MARAEFTVRAPVRACALSDRWGSIADTSSTASNRPSTPKIGAPEQLKFICRDRKCWLRWTVTGRSSAMQVPMPLVPSISSAQTPPSQVPQYSNRLASVSSPRCSTATPAVSQNRTVYPASRTTLYRRSSSSCSVEMRLPLAKGEDTRRPAVEEIHAVSVRGTLPGARQLLDGRHRCLPLHHRIDAFGVPHDRAAQAGGAFQPPHHASV